MKYLSIPKNSPSDEVDGGELKFCNLLALVTRQMQFILFANRLLIQWLNNSREAKLIWGFLSRWCNFMMAIWNSWCGDRDVEQPHEARTWPEHFHTFELLIVLIFDAIFQFSFRFWLSLLFLWFSRWMELVVWDRKMIVWTSWGGSRRRKNVFY